MIVTWRFLSILSLVSYTESECFSTSYYRDCWIRRFPGLHVDPEESQRRGAQLLQLYRGDSGQNCSRACCLSSNFSCNVAVFHYNTTQDSVNCFHLYCPTLESCILHQRANVIVYNVTKGMDPDLLIFGKPFPSNAQVHPHLASLNISDSSGTDKRQFNRPHLEPSSSAHPTILATTPKASTSAPTSSFPISTPPPLSVYSTQDNQDTFPASAIQQSTALKRSSQLISTRIITNPSTDPTIISTTKASPGQSSSMQPSISFTTRKTSSMPQPTHSSSTTITPSQLSSWLTSSSTPSSQVGFLGTTSAYTISQPISKTLPYLVISTAFSSDHTTTTTLAPFSGPLQSSTGEITTMSDPLTSSTGEPTRMPVPLKTIVPSSIGMTPTLTVPLSSTSQSSTEETTTTVFPFSSAPPSITGETTTMPIPLSSILQSRTGKTPTLTLPLPSTLQSITKETITMPVPLSSNPQTNTGETTTRSTLPTTQLSSASSSLASTPAFTPVKNTAGYGTATTGPQLMTNSVTTTSWSYNQPINPQTTASSLTEKKITPSSTTDGASQEYININLATTEVSVTTISPTTLNRPHPSVAPSETNSGLHTSPTPPTILEDSQPYPNDTKGYISRNVTTGNSPQPVSDGELTQVWHLAANTVLVALATCAALACGCCCSVLIAASWRGRRRRKGRYQTTLKGKKGSMRLIKYVFVRESS
ncbi:mucin-2-like [Hemibagrus wyckioides]|uniref:mucin-2-like n=1 Tax=Hemibagrus wyckioides TaxID=337641 RepID=UPI00266D74B1|nr:mucin-2-like [Hemibagrus wyckioides]